MKILEIIKTLFHRGKKPVEDLSWQSYLPTWNSKLCFTIPRYFDELDEREFIDAVNIRDPDLQYKLLRDLGKKIQKREMRRKDGKKET
jgi:hypothetical protein